MGNSWNLEWNSHLDILRKSCEKGIHPVWNKLAKEANIFAELSRFKISHDSKKHKDSSLWINSSYFDPENTIDLKSWLDMSLPFNAKTDQLKVIQKIKKDMANKPRFSEWNKWIDPVLRNQSKEMALVEGMILACCKHIDAIEVLDNISEKSIIDVAKKQVRLLKLRAGNLTNWEEDSKIEKEDLLSQSIRTTAWKQIENIERDFTIEELRFGIDVLSNSEKKVPDFIIWKLVFKLFEINELEQAYDEVNNLMIRNNEQLKIALKIS